MSVQSVPPGGDTRNSADTHITPRPARSLLLKAQLGYAEKGKPSFPCRPGGKEPLTGRGFKDATTDPRKIHMWRSRWPEANVGMPTGERSGVWVLDVDRPEALGELEARIGELPATAKVKTPRGGLHLYFRHVERITNSPGGLPAGIDVRGEGGYILVPPSAGYTWESRTPAAEAPAALLELVRERSRDRGRAAPANAEPTSGEVIPEGSRNGALFFEALALKDAGGTPEEVLGGLLEINRARCSPPLDAGEVEGIVRSACRYPVRSGSPSPEVLAAVGELEELWWSHPWQGMGGKTDRDVYRVLVELARRYGRLLEDGSLAVSASVRSVALAAATRYATVSGAATKRLAGMGLIRKADGGRGAAEAATWVLAPRQVRNTQASAHIEEKMPCVTGSSRPRLWELSTPAFRWTGHVKKGRAGVLYALEARGPMRLEDLAGLMGWSRTRDLRLRYVDPLVGMGLVEERGGLLSLPEDHAERVEEVRRAPYATVSRRRREGVDPETGLTVRWVEETENAASEVEREERDVRDHEKQRELFRLHLAQSSPEADEACRRLLNRMDEEREEAAGEAEPDGEISELEPVDDHGSRDGGDIIESTAEVFALAKAFPWKGAAA